MKDFAKRKKINTKNSKNRQAFGSIKTKYNGISKNTIMFLITASFSLAFIAFFYFKTEVTSIKPNSSTNTVIIDFPSSLLEDRILIEEEDIHNSLSCEYFVQVGAYGNKKYAIEAQNILNIEVQDISRHYQVGQQIVKALDSITVDIKRNEYVSFMGASGSGKSTLMNIIGCLDSPTGGKYKLNNKDVSNMSENELADIRNKEIGFVFQTFNLLPRASALDNVALPLVYAGYSSSQRKDLAMKALEDVDLVDRATHKPNELSGGQRQRVAIARALVNNPSIILADEPTGNLDSKTSYSIMDLFSLLHEKGNTIIMVTHEEDIAEYSKRIVRLKDGLISSDKKK